MTVTKAQPIASLITCMFSNLTVDEACHRIGNGAVPVKHGGPHVEVDLHPKAVLVKTGGCNKPLTIQDSTLAEQNSL